MRNSDKIKALLASPAVESVEVNFSVPNYFNDGSIKKEETYYKFCELDYGDVAFSMDENMCSNNPQTLFEGDFIVNSIMVNFHQWPEIEPGDLVMTADGEGVVKAIYQSHSHRYLVEYKSGESYNCERHEIALLAREES